MSPCLIEMNIRKYCVELNLGFDFIRVKRSVFTYYDINSSSLVLLFGQSVRYKS